MIPHRFPPIRKAIFPVAGLGTRFLPATKAIPKEMLPIIDRPLIQYAVAEAREAGIEQLIFVTGHGKVAIVEHFDTAFELEAKLAYRGKALDGLDLPRLRSGELITVRQQAPLGLGHAIWCARAVIGNEPFALVLPDELMVGEPGCMKQMVDIYNEVGGNLISAHEVLPEAVVHYGAIAQGARLDGFDGALTQVTGLVEKPNVWDAPSNMIISGRYILQPEVMDNLEVQEKARTEIHLTDAMARMIGNQAFHAFNFAGQRFDCGSKIGFVEATVALALQRPDMADEVRIRTMRLLGL